MTIEYIEGDLLGSSETVVIHGCNAKGAFGKGFAGVLKKKHPSAEKIYTNAYDEGRLILGSVLWAYDGRLIANAIVQPTYGKPGTGRHISYKALESALAAVADAAKRGVPATPFIGGFDRVAMPLIGTNLGGGEWRTIEAIVEEHLRGLSVAVYVLPGNKPSAKELASSKPKLT